MSCMKSRAMFVLTFLLNGGVKPQRVSLSVAFGMAVCVCWFIFELGGKVAVF